MFISPVLMHKNYRLRSPIHKEDQTSNRNISFNGFTKKLGKKIFIDGQKDISTLLEKHPDT